MWKGGGGKGEGVRCNGRMLILGNCTLKRRLSLLFWKSNRLLLLRLSFVSWLGALFSFSLSLTQEPLLGCKYCTYWSSCAERGYRRVCLSIPLDRQMLIRVCACHTAVQQTTGYVISIPFFSLTVSLFLSVFINGITPWSADVLLHVRMFCPRHISLKRLATESYHIISYRNFNETVESIPMNFMSRPSIRPMKAKSEIFIFL